MYPTNNKFDVDDRIKVFALQSMHYGRTGSITKVGNKRYSVKFDEPVQYVSFKEARRLRTRLPKANLIIPSRPPTRHETSTSSDNDSDSNDNAVAANSEAQFQHLARVTAGLLRERSLNGIQFEALLQIFAERVRQLCESPDSLAI